MGARQVQKQVEAEADAYTRDLELGAKVHQLRLEGVGYLRIAQMLGLAHQRTAELHSRHVQRIRELEALGAVDAARSVQDERYESLLSAVWAQALTGDLAAVKECRQILDSITAREAKVTAMITQDDDGKKSSTLIAEGATDAYIEALRRMQ